MGHSPGLRAAHAEGGRPENRAMTRRAVLGTIAAGLLITNTATATDEPIRFGLTPVFLDSDIELLARLERYLAARLNHPVNLVHRRTYQEITALLLSNQLDAAWICGFPFVQHPKELALVAVPVWRGKPLLRSTMRHRGRLQQAQE
jgi:phosphonate transport system substrate-binding protein